jgi:Cytochrome C oxidase, cbb3-type, subunit III
MQLNKNTHILFFILIAALAVLGTSNVWAQGETSAMQDIVRGAQLYDKWYAVLGVEPPDGNMPIWSRQSTNTRSGPDTWRCSECHGWDYRGAQGAYGSGSHRTGFPDVMTLAQGLSIEDIVNHLKGSNDSAHNFSSYLDNTSLTQLADFLKYGVIDDTQYINPISLQVIDANIVHGQQLFRSTCAECHGEDGKKIVFRTEGVDEYLGSVANRDPWRFLHRTRFGVAGTNMPVGVNLDWTPADGRDILAYAQTLPSESEIVREPTQNPLTTPAPLLGGPATNLWTGILTGLGMFAGMGVYAALFIGGFILVGVIVVTLLRKRK